jgi:hypothetical protein
VPTDIAIPEGTTRVELSDTGPLSEDADVSRDHDFRCALVFLPLGKNRPLAHFELADFLGLPNGSVDEEGVIAAVDRWLRKSGWDAERSEAAGAGADKWIAWNVTRADS